MIVTKPSVLSLMVRYSIVGISLSVSPFAFASASSGLQSDDIENQHHEEFSLANMERIRVTGHPMHQPGVVQLSTKTIRQPIPAQDGADFLRSITGFNSVRKGGASADPVFRGMSGSRVTILTDDDLTLGGCPSRMDPPTAYISPQSFDTVTIVKGPQQVIHGPMTAAATVRFKRDWQQAHQPGVSGHANLSAASFGRGDSNLDVASANSAGFIRAAVNMARSDDYKDGNGVAVNSAYERWNTAINAAWTPDSQSMLGISLGLSDGEAAYADRAMDGSKFRRENIGLRYIQRDVTEWLTEIEAQLFYNYVDHVMDNYSLREFTPGMMANPTASNPDRRTQGGRIRMTMNPSDDWQVISGLDGQVNTHRARSSMNQPMMSYETMPRLADADIGQLGIFTEATYSGGSGGQWIGGLRVDRWEAEDLREQLNSGHGGHGGEGGIPNPSFSETRIDTLWGGFLRYEESLDKVTWYAGVGYTERFPDYWELIGGNRSGEHSVNAFSVRPEVTVQGDAGMIWQGEALGLPLRHSLSAFYGHTKDFILLNATEMMGHAQTIVRNVDTHHYGFEWDADYQVSARWQVQVSLAYTRATNRTDERPLAQQPPLEGKFGLNWQYQSLQLGGLFRVAARQHRVAPNQGSIAGLDDTVSAGFAIFSFNASWQHSSGVRLSTGIDNLFDRAYAEHLSRNGAMISGYQPIATVNEPGRTWWANMAYTW